MGNRTADAGRAPDGQTGSVKLLDLPHGNGLSAAETVAITRRALTSVVLFAGTAGCGKTTLLASLYLLFQRGPFAGYNFAGSDTLVGFEERVSLARTASGRDAPTTPRTRVSEYLHLRVRHILKSNGRDHSVHCPGRRLGLRSLPHLAKHHAAT